MKKVLFGLTVLALVACVGLPAFAQGRGGQGRGGQGRGGQGRGGFQGFGQRGGGFGGFGGGGAMGLLGREDVQKELDILDDQKQEIEALMEDSSNARRDMMRDLFGGGGNFDREAIQEAMEKANRDVEKKLDNILLPHQSRRLKELEVQFALRGRSLAAAVTNDTLVDGLKVTDDQKEDIEKAAESIQKELDAAIAKLRMDAIEKLMGKALTSQQQAKFKDMVGKPFEFQDTQRGGFGATFGGRQGGQRGQGAPGGQRGRRPGGDN